jgi:hypothetical protein
MSNLRTKMTQDMIVRGLATSTQKAYLHAVTELSNYYDQRNPASLSKQELLDYLVHLSQERGLAWRRVTAGSMPYAFSTKSPWAAPMLHWFCLVPRNPLNFPSSGVNKISGTS